MPAIIKTVDCPEETHAPGAVVFREGTQGNCFYILKAGEIEIYKNYGGKGQILLATVPAGRVIGEVSGLDGGLRTATAVAKSQVNVVKVNSESLRWQLNQCPKWFGAIILD